MEVKLTITNCSIMNDKKSQSRVVIEILIMNVVAQIPYLHMIMQQTETHKVYPRERFNTFLSKDDIAQNTTVFPL